MRLRANGITSFAKVRSPAGIKSNSYIRGSMLGVTQLYLCLFLKSYQFALPLSAVVCSPIQTASDIGSCGCLKHKFLTNRILTARLSNISTLTACICSRYTCRRGKVSLTCTNDSERVPSKQMASTDGESAPKLPSLR